MTRSSNASLVANKDLKSSSYSVHLKYINYSPKKANEVARLVRGLSCKEACAVLYGSKKKLAPDLCKLIKSAADNAQYLDSVAFEELAIARIEVGASFSLKRVAFHGRGRTGKIRKRYSSISLTCSKSSDLSSLKENKKKLANKIS
jgi:large subunit ribosomal protein L22